MRGDTYPNNWFRHNVQKHHLHAVKRTEVSTAELQKDGSVQRTDTVEPNPSTSPYLCNWAALQLVITPFEGDTSAEEDRRAPLSRTVRFVHQQLLERIRSSQTSQEPMF